MKSIINRKNILVAAGVIVIVALILLLRSCSDQNSGNYRIQLNGESEVTIQQGDEYVDEGVYFINGKGEKADSETQAELEKKVKIDGLDELDTAVIGKYTITYKYEDQTIRRKVIVEAKPHEDTPEDTQGGATVGGEPVNGEDEQPEDGDKTGTTEVDDGTGNGDKGNNNGEDGKKPGSNGNGDDGDKKPGTTQPVRKPAYDMSGVSFSSQTFTYDGQAHSLSITGKLPEGVSVTYTGNGQVNAGAYVVIANFKGDSNHQAIPSMSARLTINKANYNMSGVSFEDATYEYDGKSHSITISGKLPTGVSVTYTGNGQVNPGKYVVKATFVGDSNHNAINPMYATLTIKEKPPVEKEDYDMSDVKFSNKTFTYNGQSHSIYISGKLPDGVSVSYTGNGKISAGSYTVVAHFKGDDQHNPIADMTAVMTIDKAIYDLRGVTFPDGTFTYDGKVHSIYISGKLPDGVSVSYTGNGKVAVGQYSVTANFVGDDNHHPISSMTATLTIKSSGGGDDDEKPAYDMSGVTFQNGSFVYDKTSHSIYVSGKLPDGVSVSYTGNGKISAGVYTVIAHFQGDDKHKPIPDMSATMTITQATYDMSGVTFQSKTFNYDGNYHSLAISGKLPDGVSVSYSSNNNQKEKGTYRIVASFTGDSKNYRLIADMEATMIIKDPSDPDPINLDNVVFNSAEFKYDGNSHEIAVDMDTLPDNRIQVSYQNGNSRSEIGKHTIVAIFKLDGSTIGTKSATLTIYDEVSLEGVFFTGYGDTTTKTYQEGVTYPVKVNTVPTGLNVTYLLNDVTQSGDTVVIGEVGIHTIVAKFESTDSDLYRWASGSAKQLSITITINAPTEELPEGWLDKVTFADGKFLFDGNEHSISVDSTTLPNENVEVSYVNGNTRTAHGVHTITAVFTFKGQQVGTKDAKLTIYKLANASTVELEWENGSQTSITYQDGKTYTIAVKPTMPEGVEVASYTCNNSDATIVANNGGVTISKVGTYTITAQLKLATNLPYEWADGSPQSKSVTITISENTQSKTPVNIDENTKWQIGETQHNSPTINEVLAERTEGFEVKVVGVPEGITVSYSYTVDDGEPINSNSAFTIKNPGTYQITATFALANTNDYEWDGTAPSAFTATIKISKNVTIEFVNIDENTKWQIGTQEFNEHVLSTTLPQQAGGYAVFVTGVPAGIKVQYTYSGGSEDTTTGGVRISAVGTYNIVAKFVLDGSQYKWNGEAPENFTAEITITGTTPPTPTSVNTENVKWTVDGVETTMPSTKVQKDSGDAYNVAITGWTPAAGANVTYSWSKGAEEGSGASITGTGTYHIVATLTLTNSNYVWENGTAATESQTFEADITIKPKDTRIEVDATQAEWQVAGTNYGHNPSSTIVLDYSETGYQVTMTSVTGLSINYTGDFTGEQIIKNDTTTAQTFSITASFSLTNTTNYKWKNGTGYDNVAINITINPKEEEGDTRTPVSISNGVQLKLNTNLPADGGGFPAQENMSYVIGLNGDVPDTVTVTYILFVNGSETARQNTPITIKGNQKGSYEIKVELTLKDPENTKWADDTAPTFDPIVFSIVDEIGDTPENPDNDNEQTGGEQQAGPGEGDNDDPDNENGDPDDLQTEQESQDGDQTIGEGDNDNPDNEDGDPNDLGTEDEEEDLPQAQSNFTQDGDDLNKSNQSDAAAAPAPVVVEDRREEEVVEVPENNSINPIMSDEDSSDSDF